LKLNLQRTPSFPMYNFTTQKEKKKEDELNQAEFFGNNDVEVHL